VAAIEITFGEEVNIHIKMAERSNNIGRQKLVAFGNRQVGMGKWLENW
jgi:hypothetical protein